MIQSLQKSHEKTRNNLQKANRLGIYEKARAIRPLILKVIRVYKKIKNEHEYTEYLQATYDKSKEMLMDIDAEIEMLEEEAAWSSKYQYQANYLKKFKKNLKKIIKLCQDSSIQYYTMLPDNMPIDVRTHCVKFISAATI
jgi:hypothetical protein